MKTFVFFSLPGFGHTNPTLNIAGELRRLGHTVIYYSNEIFKERIESSGVTYRSYDTKLLFDGNISQNISLFAKKLVASTEAGLESLQEKTEKDKPDCIIHDSFALWGQFLGSTLCVPSVSLYTTFAFNNTIAIHYPQMYGPVLANVITQGHHSLLAYTRYRRLCKKYNMKPQLISDFITARERLNIVFTSSYFQPFSKSFDNSFKFTGPSIYPRKENNDTVKLDKNKKTIYIATGTVFNNDINYYKTCINAFKNTPYQIIISLGHRLSINDLPELPKNIIVKNHLPQLEILRKTDIFITHAGMNSVNESLYYDVPMVLIPQIYEQNLNAVRVKELGAGILLDKTKITVQTLSSAVSKILSTKSYKENATKIGKTLRDAGGYKKATEEVLRYTKFNL